MRRFKSYAVTLTTLCLTACNLASDPVKPDVIVTKTDVVTAQTQVPVGCVTREQLPIVPKPTLTPEQRATADDKQKGAAEARDLQNAAAYVREASGRLQKCILDIQP